MQARGGVWDPRACARFVVSCDCPFGPGGGVQGGWYPPPPPPATLILPLGGRGGGHRFPTSGGPQGPQESAGERGRGHAFSRTFWASARRRGTATPEGCSGKARRALVRARAPGDPVCQGLWARPRRALTAPRMAGGWRRPGEPVGGTRCGPGVCII